MVWVGVRLGGGAGGESEERRVEVSPRPCKWSVTWLMVSAPEFRGFPEDLYCQGESCRECPEERCFSPPKGRRANKDHSKQVLKHLRLQSGKLWELGN